MYLNTHTYYSLRYGTIAPKELVFSLLQQNVNSVCLTDINSTSSNLEFVRLAIKNAIKPILGVDFRNKAQQQFIMLAKNNEGYESINNYLSEFLHIKDFVIPDSAKKIKNTFVIFYAQFR